MSGGETKPKVEGGEEATVSITVKDQTGGQITFKVKRSTKWKKIMDAYCQKKAVNIEHVKFVYEGDRVHPHQTPDELDMENGDLVDCLIEQLGGRS